MQGRKEDNKHMHTQHTGTWLLPYIFGSAICQIRVTPGVRRIELCRSRVLAQHYCNCMIQQSNPVSVCFPQWSVAVFYNYVSVPLSLCQSWKTPKFTRKSQALMSLTSILQHPLSCWILSSRLSTRVCCIHYQGWFNILVNEERTKATWNSVSCKKLPACLGRERHKLTPRLL